MIAREKRNKRRRERYANMSAENKEDRNGKRRSDYANMDDDKKEARNGKRRSDYADMDDDEKNERQSQARENKKKNTNRIKEQKVGSALTEDINDVERYTLGDMDCECQYCGALGFWCENKGTKSEPHFGNLCCQKGKVSVPLAQDFQLHPYIANLLTSTTDRDAIYFRSHARMFNAGMAMASTVSGKVPNEYSKGNSAYSIAGQLRRILGPMIPRKGTATYRYTSSSQMMQQHIAYETLLTSSQMKRQWPSEFSLNFTRLLLSLNMHMYNLAWV